MQGPFQYKAQKESPSLEDSSNIKILGGCHDLFSPYVGSELKVMSHRVLCNVIFTQKTMALQMH